MEAETYPDLKWIETVEGHWERGIDEQEEFYHRFARKWEGTGRMYFAMTGFISCSVNADEGADVSEIGQRVDNALKMAWLNLRYDHPTLASWVQYDGEKKKFRKVYEVGSRIEQEEWLESTFQLIHTPMTASEWCNSDPPAPKLPTLFVLITPDSGRDPGRLRRDIVFRAPHETIDGVGTFMLLNNLFTHAGQIYDDPSLAQVLPLSLDTSKLSLPMRVAASIPDTLAPDQKAMVAQIMEENEAVRQNVDILTLPFKHEVQIPGMHQTLVLRFDQARTQELLAACKSVGLTITHAFHASFAMVLRDLQERKDQERSVRYINYCLLNHRPLCKEPFNGFKHPVSVIHTGAERSLIVDMKVHSADAPSDTAHPTSLREEFIQTASVIKNYYKSVHGDRDHVARVLQTFTTLFPDLSEEELLGKTPSVPPPDPFPTAGISSLGRIDDIIAPQHGVFELDNPRTTGEELRAGIGTFLGTWRGQLSLIGAYNAAFHDKDFVLKFLNDCERIVFEGLGISNT